MQKIRVFLYCFVIVTVISSFFITCNVVPTFLSKETYIPKGEIKKDVNELNNLKLIQLLNWPIVKYQLYSRYPMIDKIYLKLNKFPSITINFVEKVPWLILNEDNLQYVISYDGTILNKGMKEVELPNKNIIFVKSIDRVIHDNLMDKNMLQQIQVIESQLKIIPLFQLQQVIIQKSSIKLVEDHGVIINIGRAIELEEKFKKLAYFLGYIRNNLNKIEYIDIEIPERVIIK